MFFSVVPSNWTRDRCADVAQDVPLEHEEHVGDQELNRLPRKVVEFPSLREIFTNYLNTILCDEF